SAELREGHGTSVLLAQVDVRDRAAVNAAAASLVAGGHIPDVLINNAGLASGMSKIHEGDPEDWDRMIDTNLKGLLNVTRAILPHMVARRRGHVVNLGSTAGHMTYPQGNVYNATKYGVRALSEGMNLDVAGTPIRVSSVDPGFAETEFSEVRFHGDAARATSRNLVPRCAVESSWIPIDREGVVTCSNARLAGRASRCRPWAWDAWGCRSFTAVATTPSRSPRFSGRSTWGSRSWTRRTC